MKERFRILAFFLLPAFLFVAVLGSSLEWPDPAAEIISNFASSGTPSLGYSFRSEGPVRSAASGEIIFIRDETDMISALPPGLGTWLAIDHGDSLVGIYGRLSQGNNPFPYMVEEGGFIGRSGLTGLTGTQGFYFSFFDRKEKQWVNPGRILPLLEDTRQPVIRSVLLRNSEGRTFNLAQTRSLAQGQYRIQVDAQDTRAGDTALSPHRISCYVNGIEKGSLIFETISARRGTLLVPSSEGVQSAAGVYEAYPALAAGEVFLTRGQAALEIIVEDMAGNSRVASYRFLVE
ncbi:MAG: M23 family metallopeptidase [Spirochaetaceae bacterium]|jgi:hypothetical protein|nr:M23 family metallopeptidase [Spirochaetaceae bacterium]